MECRQGLKTNHSLSQLLSNKPAAELFWELLGLVRVALGLRMSNPISFPFGILPLEGLHCRLECLPKSRTKGLIHYILIKSVSAVKRGVFTGRQWRRSHITATGKVVPCSYSRGQVAIIALIFRSQPKSTMVRKRSCSVLEVENAEI